MFKRKETIEKVIDISSKIDFTLLDPRATNVDIEKLCNIAYKNQYFSVCVNPVNVKYAKGYISKNFNNSIKVCCVIGFPLGANSTDIKVQEAKECIDNGADEIDVVINIAKAKENNYSYIKNEILKIRKIAKKKILKVIIETCYFDENEIIKLCKILISAKVDFIKTSTGFGPGGANENVVSLIKKTVSGKCFIKASGGIRTREQAFNLIKCGADRIGTSHII